MKRLQEIDYEKIFSPKTMAALKGKSGESLRQMLGNKSLMQAMMRSQTLYQSIIRAEEEYRDELEMVAVQIVTDAYPIVDYANIKIDAQLVGPGELNIQQAPPEDDPASPDFGEDDPEKLKAKRRIINGITQGASIRGAFGFMLFREYLDELDPELVEKYNEILKLGFGIYDDPNAVTMMLATLAQKQGTQGGQSEMEYDEENEQFVIKARATTFPILVHEIVKGLYEIVGTEGFGPDKEKNQAIVGAVDKVQNEPEDLQKGKFIYDAISDLYNKSEIEDPRVRELFFAEVYKLSDDEFFPFIENAINGELDSSQKKWALDTMRDIEKDLKKDDTGLRDLDEDFKWTSTRTDQYPVTTQSNSKASLDKDLKDDSNLWSNDIVKNRLELMKRRLYYNVKDFLLRYGTFYYNEKYNNLQDFKERFLHIIKRHIADYFFDKLEKKHNITVSRDYFQELPLIVDKVTSKLSNYPSPEEVNELWPEVRYMLSQIFKRYEKLGK